MSFEALEAGKLQVSVGKTMCHHIDGIAIGSTVQSLASHNVFDLLKKADSPWNVNRLADEVGARKGYFHIALRLLAHQGFVRLSGDVDCGRQEVTLTDDGVAWLPLVDYYNQIQRLLGIASDLPNLIRARNGFHPSKLFFPRLPNDVEGSPLHERVALHLYGALVAVIMKELYISGALDFLASNVGKFLPFNNLASEPAVAKFMADVLEKHGWGLTDSHGFALTVSGAAAAALTPQYFYPVSYLPTFESVPEILFGAVHKDEANDSTTVELHLDRDLDITFSGIIFQRNCKKPFLDLVLPIFNREPLHEQPESVVDTGSGDGTLLVELFRAIRDKTLRGRFLEAYPLTMVGAEYTKVARAFTKAALERTGIPNKTIFGDIGDPSGLSKRLIDNGIDPTNALHVSKSVIHDRKYKKPERVERLHAWQSLSKAPFALPDGSLIRPRDMECNLIELFEDWIPLTRKHGMVVIEAHTVAPELVASHVGQNIVTCLDATHGYSNQYLVESEVFTRVADCAGYRHLAYQELGGKLGDRPILTLSHFIPKIS